MKPKTLRVPTAWHHKATDQDCVQLRDADGKRHMIYLGKHGTADAGRRYREVLADHLGGKPVATTSAARSAASEWSTVGKLCAACFVHARRYCMNEAGEPTGEVERATYAFEMLLE